MTDAAEELHDFYRRNQPALIRVLWHYVGNRAASRCHAPQAWRTEEELGAGLPLHAHCTARWADRQAGNQTEALATTKQARG